MYSTVSTLNPMVGMVVTTCVMHRHEIEAEMVRPRYVQALRSSFLLLADNRLSEFQLVQDRGLPRSVEPDAQDFGVALEVGEAVEGAGEEGSHGCWMCVFTGSRICMLYRPQNHPANRHQRRTRLNTVFQLGERA